tara:strand:- start:338 stop:580 length:243 start_codon:yes stop_codon:yes gene_type:complete
MVKKIRVIDDTPEEASGINSGDRDFMEMAKTMDWKLWEILQIMQRLEKAIKLNKIDISFEDDEEVEEDTTPKTKSTAKKK